MSETVQSIRKSGGGTWELIEYCSSSHNTYNISNESRYFYYKTFNADLSKYKQFMVTTGRGDNEVFCTSVIPDTGVIPTNFILRANSTGEIGQAYYESGHYRIDAIDPNHTMADITVKFYGMK